MNTPRQEACAVTTRNGRVGPAFIKRRVREEDAGGEVTGHYYFRDFFYADNGFIPALMMLEVMSRKNQSLRDLLQPFRERCFISGEINTRLGSMAEVPRRLAAMGIGVRVRVLAPNARCIERLQLGETIVACNGAAKERNLSYVVAMKGCGGPILPSNAGGESQAFWSFHRTGAHCEVWHALR